MREITQQIITYGFHNTIFGKAVVATTDTGICWFGYMTSRDQGAYKGNAFERMKKNFSTARLVRDDAATKTIMSQMMLAWENDTIDRLKYDLRGSEFECSVWHSLLKIPRGKTVSYSDVAHDINKPKASRAVGTAVGNNPVSLVIPCHRVVRSDGGLGNYGWGLPLKEKILAAEGAFVYHQSDSVR